MPPQMEDRARQYVYERKIPMLFESLMTGLMIHRPMDHVGFLIDCLKQLRQTPDIHWDTFVNAEYPSKGSNGIRSSRPNSTSSNSSRSSTRERENGVRSSSRKSATLPPIRSAITQANETPSIGKSYSRQRTLPPIATSTPAKKEVLSVSSTFKNIVFVLGGPGSGKGTQCSRVVSEFSFSHLSTGDLLRGEVERGSSLGKELEETMQQGQLVPSVTIIQLLKSAMVEKKDSLGFLIDGFPREAEQARLFEEEIGQCVRVINFECSDDVMTGRLLQRGQTSGRVDDNETTIKKRLVTFRQETQPVIEFYKRRNLVSSVKAEGEADEVYRDVRTVVKKLITPKKHFHNVVFVLGGPGSGKGTQCSRVVSEFSFSHLSTGDLLRGEVERGSSLGKELEETMQQGQLVPSETIVTMLRSAMMERGNPPGFLIDGFPRELIQAKMFEDEVCECTQVLVLECSDDVMTRRLLQRGQTSGRVDDNETTIKKRLATFREETLPVIEFFQKQNKVKKINTDRDVHEVYGDVKTFFKKLVRPPSSLV